MQDIRTSQISKAAAVTVVSLQLTEVGSTPGSIVSRAMAAQDSIQDYKQKTYAKYHNS